jgi:DNA-binding NarL/FixJ family response regulator
VVVLLVDDAPLVRARLRERFELAGMRVLEACDRNEAGGLARRNASDIRHVVIDVHVAGFGADGLAELRRELPRAVLIVLTNEASTQHRRACLACGADFFFDKSHEFDRAIAIVAPAHTTPAS